eukprot:Polyplicarium_translucidae@DN2780_c0_g1_i3.p1
MHQTAMTELEDIFDPTLSRVMDMESLEWIFVGGKGGVGKTTTACSVAIQLAQRRDSVLILSTDPAHNLSDAFSQKFSNAPTRVNGFTNLFAMEIETSFEPTVQFKMADGLSSILPELMASLPGVDEAFSFAELMNAVQSMRYSCIVFDTAPTGHTLRLLSFPDILEKALAKIVSLRDKMQGAFSMFGMAGSGMSEDTLLSKLDKLRAVTNSVREAFSDPTRTTFVCVCIPEFLSVYETERLVQELARQNIDCSNIIVNQVLFPIDIPESDEEKPSVPNSSDSSMSLAAENAADFHVVCVPLQTEEVRGVELLQKFGHLLYEPRTLPLVDEI